MVEHRHFFSELNATTPFFAAGGAIVDEEGDTVVPSITSVLDLYQSILADPSLPRTTREYLFNSIMKLSARSSEEGGRIRTLVRNEM